MTRSYQVAVHDGLNPWFVQLNAQYGQPRRSAGPNGETDWYWQEDFHVQYPRWVSKMPHYLITPLSDAGTLWLMLNPPPPPPEDTP